MSGVLADRAVDEKAIVVRLGFGGRLRGSAPKARQIFSLGREPQETGYRIESSREAATDNERVCRPFRARLHWAFLFLGLTPQAMNLSPLRGLMEWRPVPFCGLTPQAMNLSPLRDLMDFVYWGPTPVSVSVPDEVGGRNVQRLNV